MHVVLYNGHIMVAGAVIFPPGVVHGINHADEWRSTQSFQRVFLRFDACDLSWRVSDVRAATAGCSACTGIASIVADVVQLAASLGAWVAADTKFILNCVWTYTARHCHCHSHLTGVASWSWTSLFSTNMAISETKGQGWRVIRTQWRKASDILTSTLATFLFSSHPKKGNGSRGSFNYYASAYNRGDNYHITRLKLNIYIQCQNQQVNCRHIKITYLFTAPEPARGSHGCKSQEKHGGRVPHVSPVNKMAKLHKTKLIWRKPKPTVNCNTGTHMCACIIVHNRCTQHSTVLIIFPLHCAAHRTEAYTGNYKTVHIMWYDAIGSYYQYWGYSWPTPFQRDI